MYIFKLIHVAPKARLIMAPFSWGPKTHPRRCRRRRITGRRPVHITAEGGDKRAEGPFMSPPKAAIYGPKARLIMGRRHIFLRAEGPFTLPPKAAKNRPKASSNHRRRRWLTGQRPVHVAAEGGNSRAEGPFNHGPMAHFPAGRRPLDVIAKRANNRPKAS